jgi:thymidylate synthase (FAD)
VDELDQFPHIKVLDKGYVRLVDYLGSDLSVVNAAKASFNKEADSVGEKEIGLIKFLARNGHTSPFRHAMCTFEVKAPIMVARQWYTYVVGSDHTMDGWNEASRRYITMDTEFYVPKKDEWRSAPENKKQGSGDPISDWDGQWFTAALMDIIDNAEKMYNAAIEFGIAPEQARLLLPAYSLYTNWRWTASLQSVTHFLNQRLAHDAQAEITSYAKALIRLIYPIYPHSVRALVDMEL